MVQKLTGEWEALKPAELDANPVRAVRRSIEPIRQTLITRFDGTSVPEDFYLYRSTFSDACQISYRERHAYLPT